jgi:hypothetical protein
VDYSTFLRCRLAAQPPIPMTREQALAQAYRLRTEGGPSMSYAAIAAVLRTYHYRDEDLDEALIRRASKEHGRGNLIPGGPRSRVRS